MTADNILEFYGDLGFEETPIEDGLTALGYETDDAGHYVLLTDDDGNMPQNLNQQVVLTLYTPEGAFLWSATFKNSRLFRDTWAMAATPAEKLTAVENHRAECMR